MKNVSAYFRYFLFVIALMFAMLPSAYSANYTTYQAKIVKPNGYPLESTNVNFRFTILDPAGTCILYTENYNSVNMANTGGIISFSLGSGVKTFPVSSTTFFDVFNNAVASHTCDAGGPPNFVPLANDTRKIVMQFHDGSGWQTLPAMMINAVPYAMYANDSQSLGGVAAANYVRYSTIPTCSASQALHYTMAGFNCVNLPDAGNFTANDVANALSYTPANAASFTSLTNEVGNVSSSVNAVSATVYAVSSTVQSLTSNFSSFQNAVAVSLAAITSSQWVTSGSAISYSNNVGIGTDSPATKLDVAGGLRISMEAAACAPGLAGTLRYNAGAVEYCNGSTWTAFGVSGAGLQSLNGSTSGTQSFANGTAGTLPAFNTVGAVHTLNIPFASAGSVTAGLISNADYVSFANKLNATSAAVISALGYTPASASALSSYVLRANNLSDLTSSATARANLGLGGFATISALDLGSASATGILADARLANQTNVTSGAQYTKVTVDGKGRVISGAQLTSSDVATALGYTPANATSGVTSLNGSTSQTQSFAIGTTGTAPVFNTAAGVHTLNIPLASAGSVTAGLLSNADYLNFSNKITSSAASIAQVLGYVPASATALGSYLVRANNLSDLTSSATARANLGLGGFATISALDLGSASATGILADARLANQANVTSGAQYTKVTVDGKGRVVSGAQLSSSDVNTALGYTAANSATVAAIVSSQWTTSGSAIFYNTGNVGVGTASATARLHLAAGATSLAPLKLTSGALLTTPASGSIEYDGNYYYITDGTNTRRAIATVASPGTFDGASTITNVGNITLFPNNGTGSVVVSATTASTNSSTGALIVRGGLGVAGNINTSGTITTSSNIQGVSITATNGMISPYIAGSVASGGSLTIDSTTHAAKGNILLAPNGGKIGIGIANPEDQLHLSKAIKFTNNAAENHFSAPTADSFRLFVHDDQATGNPYQTYGNNSIIFENSDGNNPNPDDSFYFINHGTSGPVIALTIKGTGNVGLGTSTPAAVLDVVNTGGETVILRDKDSLYTDNAFSSYIRAKDSANNSVWYLGEGTGSAKNVSFMAYQTGYPLTFSTSSTERMRIDDTGKVGIGTSAPGSLLTVAGAAAEATIVSQGVNSISLFGSGSAYFQGRDVTNDIEYIMGTSTGNEVFAGSMSAHDFSLRTGNTTRMYIDHSSGFVGIGTTVPTDKLHVVGNGLFRSNNTLFKVQETNHAVGSAEIQVGQSDWYGFLKYDTATDVFSIDTALNGVATGSGGLHIKHTSGNVGIGVSNATQALHVVGNIRVEGDIYGGGNSAGTPSGETNGMWVYGPSYAGFGMFYTEGSPDKISISPNGGGTSDPVMVLNGSGYVGIGTSSPITALNISGTGSSDDDIVVDSIGTAGEATVMLRRARGTAASPTALLANDRMGFYTFRGYNGSSYVDLARIEGRTETALATEQSGNLQFYTTYDGSNTEKMRITASGAVGIGTTTPSAGYLLDVNGDMVVGNGGTSQQIRFKTASTDGAFIRFNSTGDAAGLSALEIGTTDNSDEVIKFIQTNTERMRIHTNGYVGIGTATPTTHLSIAASGGYTIISNRNTAAGGLEWRWYSSSTGAPLGANSMCFGLTGCIFNLYSTGDATLSGSLTQSSDARLKRDISSIPDALLAVSKLEGVTYYWNDPAKDSAKQLGLIAQNVEKVFPEAVKTNAQGFKSVAYQNLIAPVIEAIKELLQRVLGVEATIKQQSQEIEMLKEKSSKLEEQNKALQQYLCAKDPQAPICK